MGDFCVSQARISLLNGYFPTRTPPNLIKIPNFTSHQFAPKRGKNIKKKRSFITFEACFSRIWMHSVPFSRVGNVGKVEV